MTMRVAIVGGTGQIGMATALQLTGLGIEVFLISRRRPAACPTECNWRAADIADANSVLAAFKEIMPQRVLNLAASLQFACDKDPVSAIRINVDGALNVLETCSALAVDRVVFGSSIAVYGERSDRMHEDDATPSNIGLYGQTKLLGEVLGKRYEVSHGMRFIALRYSGVFGDQKAASSGMSLVRTKIQMTASGADITIHEASGTETIHLTHVTDAAEATCSALLNADPTYSIYNVAGPHQNFMSLSDFHATLKAAVPGCGNIIWAGNARSAGPVDTSRLRTDLNFSPKINVTSELLRELALKTRKEEHQNFC